MSKRVGGTIFIKADGVQFNAKGQWTYNLGAPKRDAVIGADGHHGYTEKPQESFFEGEITDTSQLDLVNTLLTLCDATITLELANGKTIVLTDGYYSGSGNVQTEEGSIEARFTGDKAYEVK